MENYPNYPHVYHRNNAQHNSLTSNNYHNSYNNTAQRTHSSNSYSNYEPDPDDDEWFDRKPNYSANYLQQNYPSHALHLNTQSTDGYNNPGQPVNNTCGDFLSGIVSPRQLPQPPHYVALPNNLTNNPNLPPTTGQPVHYSSSPSPSLLLQQQQAIANSTKLYNSTNSTSSSSNNTLVTTTNKPNNTSASNNSYGSGEQLLGGTNNSSNVHQQHAQNAAVLRQLQAKFSETTCNNSASGGGLIKDPPSSNNYSQLQVQTTKGIKNSSSGSNTTTTTTTTCLNNTGSNNNSGRDLGRGGVRSNGTNNGENLLGNSGRGLANSTPAPTINANGGNSSSNEDGWSGAFWLHGRIPLLILLVLLLFIVFLSFSAALVYFKYVPYYGSTSSVNNNGNKFNKGSMILEDEPCEQTYCAFGANCIVENGRATCRCPESCAAGYAPVCGSDDVTYANECLLRKFACKHQKTVRIKRTGECDMADPCADKACLFGSRCVPSADGHYAACECPKECPNYGDTEESQNVCGSDGKLYKNKCELNRHSCHLSRSITVKYLGKCDPCEDIICTAPQICQLDEDRRPNCRCSEVCSMEFNPVCASDGRTFTNECVMRQEACRSRRDLRVIYRGKCSSGVNPCESRTCKGYESCAINRFGIAQCTCAMVCDPIIQPVCGTDGKSYDNYCQLTAASCRESRDITVAYKGICESTSLCARTTCPPGATCMERNGIAICDCPTCPSDYDPVCGSDGVSYQNPCRLKMEACTTNTSIEVLYSGLCNGCEQKQCDYYSICESDMMGTRCICPQNCTTKFQESSIFNSPKVCGTDGVIYENECELQKASCLQKKFIVVASTGHCDLCANIECKFGAKCESGICECPTNCPVKHEPVCASNFQTFQNECELQKAACSAVQPLTLLFYGNCSEGRPLGGSVFHTSGFGISSTSPTTGKEQSSFSSNPQRPKLCESIRCDYDALCEIGEDGFPRCTCQFNCTGGDKSRVCASDLKLYHSECEMKREACHRQTELRPRPMELCEEVEVKPCHGEEPVKYPGTDVEINCGNGPTRSNCPQGTFCHRSPSFSKCCRKHEEKVPTSNPIATIVSPSSNSICAESLHGCCPDEVTPALGPELAGCPSTCQCNKVGSIVETCDPVTQDCSCRPGVGGAKCDRCLPGFWGLSRIVSDGHPGCMNCQCSKFGSVRDDCEQMTGRCVCKPRILGHKCDSCSEGEFLGPYGCTSDPINLGRTCDQVTCSYGAECEQDGNRAGCVCNVHCDDKNVSEVCASDGFTYESECLVRLQSCRGQKPIWVMQKGSCPDSSESDGTESPTQRRWTAMRLYTEPGDYDDGFGNENSGKSNSERWGDQAGLSSSGMKSTRHLPPQSNYHDNFQRNFFSHRSPTSATVEIKSYLGDSCQSSPECVTTYSVCLGGTCICREGFYEDSERIQCKPIHSHLSKLETCVNSQCHHSSTCFDHFNGSHSCVCPLGFIDNGEGCVKQGYPYPFFTGQSTITLGKLAGYHKLSIEVEITPFMDYEHGIIIFSSQHANGSGDFLSLALIDGYIEFRYGLGDGPAKLRSVNRLMSGSTYHIVAKRYNRDGLLRLNDEEDVKGTSPGNMKSLNLDHGGYMGYVPLNSTKIWETVGTSQGFIGCVHKLIVGRRPIDFFGTRDPLISSVEKVYQCLNIRNSAYHHLSTTQMNSPMYILNEAGEENESQLYVPLELQPLHFSNSSNGTSSNRGTMQHNPCSKNPCRNNGHCWTDSAQANFIKCVCHPEYSGKHCESKITNIQENGAMLDFRGFTFLELPKIENGGRFLSIELWVMIRAMNGLILYNGQYPGKGDYIAIHVLNGHVQFLFDLGSGMGNLTWIKPITINKWHWIHASREGREGKLQVDGEKAQITVSPPSLSELNLELPLSLGGIRDTSLLHRELGLLAPFDGVFQYMRINGATYHKEISMAIKERKVHKYEGPPCGSSVLAPCENGGTCFSRLSSFACLCTSAYTGKTCEHRKEIPGPVRFDGQNFLKFPRKVVKSESFNFTSDYDDFYNENFDSQLDELFGESVSSSSSNNNADESDEADFANDFDDTEDEFVPFLEQEFSDRIKIQRRNRIEVVFRTTSELAGVLIWTGSPSHNSDTKRGYLGLFLVDGFPELRIDLGSKNKKPVIIRSKVKVSDSRWHQVLIARRRRFIVFQVDGSSPQRATAPAGSNTLHSDGRFWIGGIAPSVLPGEVPAKYHQGFVGCVDLVRIEKRRLPLTKIAYATGTPFCEDDD